MMDEVTLVGHERHLEDRAMIQMTNAATNTPPGKHVQLAGQPRGPLLAGSQAARLASGVGGEQTQWDPQLQSQTQSQSQPQRKKRGPKAGRKAALAVAAAAAASTSGYELSADCATRAGHLADADSLNSAQLQHQRRQTQQPNDPYAFHCDSMPVNYGSQMTINDRRQSPARNGGQRGQQKQPSYLNGPRTRVGSFEEASESILVQEQQQQQQVGGRRVRSAQSEQLPSSSCSLLNTSSVVVKDSNEQRQLTITQNDTCSRDLHLQFREAPISNPTSSAHYQEGSVSQASSRQMIVHKQSLGQASQARVRQQQSMNMQHTQHQHQHQHQIDQVYHGPEYNSNTSADHHLHSNTMYQQQQQQQPPQSQSHQIHQEPHRFAPQVQRVGRAGQPMSNHNRLAGYPHQQQQYNAANLDNSVQANAAPQVPLQHQAPYHHHQPAESGALYEQAPLMAGSNFGPPEEPHQRGLAGPLRQQQQAAPSRVPPYGGQAQHHQIPVRSAPGAPNRVGVNPQAQYKQEVHQFTHQAPPQQQQQQHTAYVNNPNNQQANGYHMNAPAQSGSFADHQVDQYPSNSPTLLQQQLNRQTGPPAPQQQQQPRGLVGAAGNLGAQARLAPGGYAAAGPPANKPAASRQLMARYVPEQQVIYGEQQVASQQHRNNRPGEQVAYYPAGGAAVRQAGGPATVQPAQQQQPARYRQQVLPAGPQPATAMPPEQHPLSTVHHHHHHQQHQPAAQFLGNPTPPLTPTSAGGHLAPGRPHQPAPVTPDGHQWQHGGPMNDMHVQQAPVSFNGPTNPPLQTVKQQQQYQLSQQNESSTSSQNGQHRIMPKNVSNSNFQYQPTANNSNHLHHNHNHHQHHHNVPTSHQVPLKSSPQNPHHHQHQHHSQQQQVIDIPNRRQAIGDLAPSQTRLTLPLSDPPLLGPFRLDHEAQFTSKVFHIKPQLFDTLSKSINLMNPQTATSVKELQFRAYLMKSGPPGAPHQGDSLLASNNQPVNSKSCNWPELFQLSINQNVINLDRSKVGHKAADIFQYCHVGDNMIDIQVNDCYCTHEFVMEAVDRPTLKAFMNSCFKSRLLATEDCIQKLKFHFGTAGFLMQNQNLQQATSIINEYVTEFVQGIEQTRTRVSLRCPISARRMTTPTRGHNCKHLQCFDLESFLYLNRERSRWNCPICSLSIPFNMLELDQHQIMIVRAMSETLNTDDILMDSVGQWQTYYGPSEASTLAQQQPPPSLPPPPRPSTTGPQASMITHSIPQKSQVPQQIHVAKSTGTYHPQAPMQNGAGANPFAPHQHHPNQTHHGQSQPMRPVSGSGMSSLGNRSAPIGSPASWDGQMHTRDGTSPQMVGRPHPGANQAPVAPGRRSANGSPLAKRPYAGQYSQVSQESAQHQSQAVTVTGAPPGQASTSPAFFNNHQDVPPTSSGFAVAATTTTSDDLSPLAAMERTIIQHEQQMGPPPFDPNSLTSSTQSGTMRNPSGNSLISPSQPVHEISPANSSSQAAQTIQTSPHSSNANVTGHFSPASHNVSSPISARVVPVSPQQSAPRGGNQPVDIPQSPMQQQSQQAPSGISLSTPATPSSSILVLGGPETPATPSNSGAQHCGGPNSVSAAISHSPHVGSASSGCAMSSAGQQQQSGVDHQPLSNGSASAGSITSSSTMTPSGQSLGSVGMGGDSRCGTAPLQGNGLMGLDDLMLPSGTHSGAPGCLQFKQGLHGSSPHIIDEKNEILMGKLMMDSNESILRDHRNGDLAIALEEADWKQQLDRGKSEHLANFLNEPLMKRQQSHHYHQQQQQQSALSKGMISGGLNPSDDEGGNQSHGSSPSHNLDQLEFANYMEADAGLPPDDSILDLFER